MSIIHDFKSIRRKLERQEQKAEFEEKNPKPETSMYGWLYGAVTPLTGAIVDPGHAHPLTIAELPCHTHTVTTGVTGTAGVPSHSHVYTNPDGSWSWTPKL